MTVMDEDERREFHAAKTGANRVRRTATRRGLVAQKKRSRDPKALLAGTWRVFPAEGVVPSSDGPGGEWGEWGLSIETVEAFLNSYDASGPPKD